MDQFTEDAWLQIIRCGGDHSDKNWHIYAGLLAIPQFARLVMRDPVKWRKLLQVEQKMGKTTVWLLGNHIHREDDLPAVLKMGERGSEILEWYNLGKLHRAGGNPAVIDRCKQKWYEHGKLHRADNLPAITINAIGVEWSVQGLRHRTDGPAYIRGDNEEWYIAGKLHRDGDLPARVHFTHGVDGDKFYVRSWYQHGNLHRDGDQPAFVSTYRKVWSIDGKKHRDSDQPAVVYQDGTQKWFKHGLKHRDNDQPAYTSPTRQEWWWCGLLHRGNGLPAVVDGLVQEWYVMDKFIDRCYLGPTCDDDEPEIELTPTINR